jgi:hypothetical protein
MEPATRNTKYEMKPIRIVPKHYKNKKNMKRKILALALTGMFTLGLIASINTNKTNQEKNIEILQNSKASIPSINCTLDGSTTCPLWPDGPEYGDDWRVHHS